MDWGVSLERENNSKRGEEKGDDLFGEESELLFCILLYLRAGSFSCTTPFF
jgi:hypothetical protein